MVKDKEIKRETELEEEKKEEEKTPVEEEPEQGLEEMVDAEGFENFRVAQGGSTLPALNQMAAPSPTFIPLEEGVSNAPRAISGTEDHDPNKYMPTQQEGEKKYISDPANVSISPEHRDVEQIGRAPDRTVDQSKFFMSSETNNSQSETVERYDPVKTDRDFNQNIDQIGRTDPHKTGERRYDFKMPKP